MSIFRYYWERSAGLLVVACQPATIRSGVIAVQVKDLETNSNLGIFPFREVEGGNIAVVGVPVLDEDEAVALRISGIWDGTSPPGNLNDQIELYFGNPDGGHEQSDLIWGIALGAAGPELLSLDSSAQITPNFIGTKQKTPKEGATIFPSVSTATVNHDNKLRMDCIFDDSGPKFTLRFSARSSSEAAFATTLSVGILPARTDALALIEGRNSTLSGYIKKEIELLPGQESVEIVIPFKDRGGTTHQTNLDFLDRIIIQTNPPAEIEFVYSPNDPVLLDPAGAGVLAFGGRERMVPDSGDLTKIFAPSVQPRLSFDPTSQLPLIQNFVRRADRKKYNEIVCFLYAQCRLRIESSFQIAGGNLSPLTVDEFLLKPAFYWALGAIDPNILDARAQQVVAANVRSDAPEDAVAVLAKTMVSSVGISKDIISEWESQSHPDTWTKIFVANFQKLRSALAGGIVPGPGEISVHLSMINETRNEIAEYDPLFHIFTSIAREPAKQGDVASLVSTPAEIESGLATLRRIASRLDALVKELLEFAGVAVNDGFTVKDMFRTSSGDDTLARMIRIRMEGKPSAPDPDLDIFSDSKMRNHAADFGAFLIGTHFEMVKQLVSVGLVDPTQNQNSFAQPNIPNDFRHALDPDLQGWLETEPEHPIVREWWNNLREQCFVQS